MIKRASVLTAAVVAVALAPSPRTDAGLAADSPRPDRLRSFASCEALVQYGLRHARRYGRPDGPMPMALAAPEADAESDAGSGGGRSPEPFSTTNVQEAGIDEPDIVKTDGSRIFALARGKLHAVDVTSGAPRLLGTLDLGSEAWDQQLFLLDDRVLLMWTTWREDRDVTMLAEVDASDPAAMRVTRTVAVDGSLLSARMTGTTARVVLRSTPQAIVLPAGAPGRQRAARWLPQAELRDHVTGTRVRRPAVGCRDVRRATSFSGLGMVTVLTLDAAQALEVSETDTLMTDAETVYASAGGLYLATGRWLAPGRRTLPAGYATTIHRFDTTHPTGTSYRGSGVVPGTLLNQFSMSEHDGVLRVASSDTPAWWGGQEEDGESFVTTLRADPATGELVEAGRVGGLGRGERIYAVRFIGTVGYVVTFRETDPLYTIDLSDPARPRVLGELKIEGYSAYLHPAGDGRLIGIGQDATRRGRRLGTQVSLFDVSDPSAPRRLAHHALGEGSSSEAEYDHHAFLWWPDTSLAVVPVTRWDGDREHPDSAAIGLRVQPGAIEEVGRARHPERRWDADIRRALVAGGQLYTLSGSGLLASSLDTLAPRAWLPLR